DAAVDRVVCMLASVWAWVHNVANTACAHLFHPRLLFLHEGSALAIGAMPRHPRALANASGALY
ncbi:MAG TPA: hypothetical protein VEI25_15435, partial [Paraburkholderia sp.]|nr:hypothetical protein [Paraburkholderia sp.]